MLIRELIESRQRARYHGFPDNIPDPPRGPAPVANAGLNTTVVETRWLSATLHSAANAAQIKEFFILRFRNSRVERAIMCCKIRTYILLNDVSALRSQHAQPCGDETRAYVRVYTSILSAMAAAATLSHAVRTSAAGTPCPRC